MGLDSGLLVAKYVILAYSLSPMGRSLEGGTRQIA